MLMAAIGMAACFTATAVADQNESSRWGMPKTLPEDEYGNTLMKRSSEKSGMRPVSFSHWQHRTKYTCRVCHLELEFNMKAGTTEITESANKAGRFCGACHNGKTAFGHSNDNCTRCHNGDIGNGKEQFSSLRSLPRTKHGNGIDWMKSLETGQIKPANQVLFKPSKLIFNRNITFEATGVDLPPVVFSHKAHNQWLACSNCHPDVFDIEKNHEIHYSMKSNMNGEYCGACHLSVAFPLNDCKRCHKEK